MWLYQKLVKTCTNWIGNFCRFVFSIYSVEALSKRFTQTIIQLLQAVCLVSLWGPHFGKCVLSKEQMMLSFKQQHRLWAREQDQREGEGGREGERDVY